MLERMLTPPEKLFPSHSPSMGNSRVFSWVTDLSQAWQSFIVGRETVLVFPQVLFDGEDTHAHEE